MGVSCNVWLISICVILTDRGVTGLILIRLVRSSGIPLYDRLGKHFTDDRADSECLEVCYHICWFINAQLAHLAYELINRVFLTCFLWQCAKLGRLGLGRHQVRKWKMRFPFGLLRRLLLMLLVFFFTV